MNSALMRCIFICLLMCGWQSADCLAQTVVDGSLDSSVELGDPPIDLNVAPGQSFASAAQYSEILQQASPVSPDVRSSVVDFFDDVYVPAFSVPIGWTGDPTTCDAGTTSQAYIDASFDLINYFRAMVKLLPVVNDVSKNAASQEAALMMSVNNNLSHSPPPQWQCYTADGANAAGSSNIALGATGPRAIALYIRDPGASNAAIGHRRWILHPPRASFGIGSVGSGTKDANALWVFAGTTTRPPTDIVAWPPRGFVPYQVVYPRWSFSLNSAPGADYSSASVHMTENGVPISLNIVSNEETRYGDNTLVWEPSGLGFSAGQADRVFDIEVSNVSNAGQTVFSYQVTIIDPAMMVVNPGIFTDGFE